MGNGCARDNMEGLSAQKIKKAQKALVLLSGGMNSTTCATMAVNQYGAENVHILFIKYGQKHSREIEAVGAIANVLGISDKQRSIIELPSSIFEDSGSTLIQGGPTNPQMSYREIEEAQGVSSTYVPFRNGNLLSLASVYALKTDCEVIYFGIHAEDARNWAYPDCTPEFIGAMANAIYVGTYYKVRLVTPLEWMMKTDVVRKAVEIGVPLSLTWSCCEDGEKPCRKCPTCVEREVAFLQAGYIDPALVPMNK